MNILVFDLGTTYFKASVFSDHGVIAAAARRPTPIEAPVPDRKIIAPGSFQETVKALLLDLEAAVPGIGARVNAVTFATQTNSFLLIDAAGEPITPIILWSDDRARGEWDDRPASYATTGVPAIGHAFMVAKIAWLQRHEPRTIQSASRLCLISDYFTYLFAGQHVTEAGAVGLTGLLNIHNFTWRADALEDFSIPETWLPQPVRAGSDIGCITSAAAKAFGLSSTSRFIVGCLDQYAGAIGVGNVLPGGVSETTGTVLATVRCSTSFADTNVFQGPAFDEGMYYQMAFGSTAGNWLESFQRAQPDNPSFADLDAEAEAAAPLSYNIELSEDEQVRMGQLETIARQSGRGHAVRAILEAVARALRNQVDTLCGNERPRQIASAGGAARSALWSQRKADMLGCPVVTTACAEPTSLGAAILARRALTGESIQEIAQQWVRPLRRFEPHQPQHEE